jgi:hypothetical protein
MVVDQVKLLDYEDWCCYTLIVLYKLEYLLRALVVITR